MKTARIVGMAVILMMVAGAAALPPETSGTSSAKDGKTPDPAPAVEKDRGMEMYAVIPDSMAVWGCLIRSTSQFQLVDGLQLGTQPRGNVLPLDDPAHSPGALPARFR